jgi:Asp-tRNA(Asn)/Glu-tRNA(Gln) amidotransferase A subunit family amidase
MDFRDFSVSELVGKVKSKDMSAREMTQAALSNIETQDKAINAFCALNAEAAMAQADAIDATLASGEDPGALAGIPIGIKDLEDAAGFVTTYGSALHTDDAPAVEDSVLVSRLRAAGCVILGKTNTPEFGHKGKTDNVPFGVTKNPWNMDYSPGGSSGGSAAALAAGMIPLATGSDGGGSIRIPSALCGLSGIKTSQGRIPNGGKNPPGSGLLTVKGPMARTTLDTALALDVTVGDHATDIFAQEGDGAEWASQLTNAVLPEKVIWSPTMGFATLDKEILRICEKAVEKLQAAGVTIIENDKIWDEDPVRSWMVFWASARARAQQHLMNTPDWPKVDPVLQQMIQIGATKMTGAAYASAIDSCHHLNYQLEIAFKDAPLIITPATCGQPPKLEGDGSINGEETPGWVAFTMGINMTRNPAGVVPAGLTESGLPVALQIIGRQRDDIGVLKAMHTLEPHLELGTRASC